MSEFADAADPDREDASGSPAVALVELLGRVVLGGEQPDDHAQARALLRAIDADDPGNLVFGASAGAVAAVWGDLAELGSDPVAATLAAARALPSRTAPPHETALGALAACLIAFAGGSLTPAEDAVRGAEILRTVEQHELCGWAARRALAVFGLTPSQRATALILIAVAEQDPTAGEEAIRIARSLPEGDPGRHKAEALWPSLDFRRTDVERRAALEGGDRPSAARSVAETVSELRTPQTDDALLEGLEVSARGLASEQIDVDAVRAGMTLVLRHWRERMRTGFIPPIARAGIENIIALLKRDLTGPAPQLLFEIVEALADHGLSSLDGQEVVLDRPGAAAGAILHSDLSGHAAREVRWPDLAWIVSRLGQTNVVLTHSQRRFTDGRLEITALQLRPPTYPALKQVSLDAGAQQTLDRLASQDLDEIDDVSSEQLEGFVRHLLPPTLLESLAGPEPPSVVLVPDGQLRAVPWHAIGAPMVVAPSMTLHASLEPPSGPIRSVVIAVDYDIPGADHLISAIDDVRGADIEVIEAQSIEDIRRAPGYDLLVVYAHGGGQGLDYRLALPGGTAAVAEIAGPWIPRRVLIASCRSGRMPPASFPLSPMTALLLGGGRTVVGGLWPLPSVSTAEIVAESLRAIAGGASLSMALHSARLASKSATAADRLGLTVFGVADSAKG